MKMVVKNLKLAITGMHCNHCVGRVKDGLLKIEGVDNVNVSLEQNSAHLDYDDSKVSIPSIIQKVEDIGYSAKVNE